MFRETLRNPAPTISTHPRRWLWRYSVDDAGVEVSPSGSRPIGDWCMLRCPGLEGRRTRAVPLPRIVGYLGTPAIFTTRCL
jgi:hypothetical protein